MVENTRKSLVISQLLISFATPMSNGHSCSLSGLVSWCDISKTMRDSKELLLAFSSAEEVYAKRKVSECNVSKRYRYKAWFDEYKSEFRCGICKKSPDLLQTIHVSN